MIVQASKTDVTTYVHLDDSTTHAPNASVTVTDIDLYYVKELAAISAKVDCTALAAATSAHADNKAFNVGQGIYRIDWPDAAFSGSVGTKVELIVVCASIDTVFIEVELSPSVSAAGAGSTAWTYTVTDSVTADPIPFAEVRISTDVAGTNVIARATSNTSGVATFYLDTGVTVYVWKSKDGYDFGTQPDTEVVS